MSCLAPCCLGLEIPTLASWSPSCLYLCLRLSSFQVLAPQASFVELAGSSALNQQHPLPHPVSTLHIGLKVFTAVCLMQYYSHLKGTAFSAEKSTVFAVIPP